ncbi:Signal transducer [Citrus sinensis]|uniref:Signal transducer n=1 Tax=Citrus sinensis TaxID=2711 RepID=A0ACB8LCY3_CITSI|nr:Signal transducer [Citrus sinensis]
MSQQNINSTNLSYSSNIPVSEVYWSLVEKADKKFSKIRDLPYYERNRYDTYFYKVFKVYTQLWKFQQENREKLVEAGLKRYEIGEIASRIAQLYFGQYMRTSDMSYLSESYIFYEAILTREYFRDGLHQHLNLANKQLRFLARFLMVCLVLNRREMVHQLVNQLKMWLDECKRVFQETDFKEWKLVVQEIVRFLKADTAFMNIRPLRYSLVLDPRPDDLPHVSASVRSLKLRDAILSSYHHNEIKFSELTLDTFRMLQCLEWEPSGSFYQSSNIKTGQNGGPGPSRINYSQDITDPSLPPNPRKAILYRPSVTHFLAVLATICEELPHDGVLLIYLSASGARNSINAAENINRNFQSHTISSDATSASPFSSPCNSPNPTLGLNKGDCMDDLGGCLHFGTRGNRGTLSHSAIQVITCSTSLNQLYYDSTQCPCLVGRNKRRGEKWKGERAIKGSEKGEPAALLISPSSTIPIAGTDFSRSPSGSSFTIFLTAPLQAFCLLLGILGSENEMDTYTEAEKLLSSSLNDWGSTLATSDNLDPVWAQILRDPFLRRLLLRYCSILGLVFMGGAEKHAGGDGEDAATAARRYVKNARAILRTLADIYEHPSHYSFVLDIPGLEASNIKVKVDNGILHISGKKKKGQSAENEGGVKAIRIERRRARYMRKFTLPQDLSPEEVKAIYKDGVLTVTVAKKVPEVSRRPKTVTIPVS